MQECALRSIAHHRSIFSSLLHLGANRPLQLSKKTLLVSYTIARYHRAGLGKLQSGFCFPEVLVLAASYQ